MAGWKIHLKSGIYSIHYSINWEIIFVATFDYQMVYMIYIYINILVFIYNWDILQIMGM